MIKEERQSPAVEFLRMDSYSRMYSVTFRLKSKRMVVELYEVMDDNLPSHVDLFFVYQDLSTDNYYAVFTYTATMIDIKKYFKAVRNCTVVNCEQIYVKQLFYRMAYMNFREFDMFDRLQVKFECNMRGAKSPFTRAVLQKNVMRITDYEAQLAFLDQEVHKYIVKKVYKQTGKQSRKQQRINQKNKYGENSLRFQIHDAPTVNKKPPANDTTMVNQAQQIESTFESTSKEENISEMQQELAASFDLMSIDDGEYFERRSVKKGKQSKWETDEK